MQIIYNRGYDKPETLNVREISYDPWEDIIILQLSDYTTLHASYLEKKNEGWVAGIPENY